MLLVLPSKELRRSDFICGFPSLSFPTLKRSGLPHGSSLSCDLLTVLLLAHEPRQSRVIMHASKHFDQNMMSRRCHLLPSASSKDFSHHKISEYYTCLWFTFWVPCKHERATNCQVTAKVGNQILFSCNVSRDHPIKFNGDRKTYRCC